MSVLKAWQWVKWKWLFSHRKQTNKLYWSLKYYYRFLYWPKPYIQWREHHIEVDWQYTCSWQIILTCSRMGRVSIRCRNQTVLLCGLVYQNHCLMLGLLNQTWSMDQSNCEVSDYCTQLQFSSVMFQAIAVICTIDWYWEVWGAQIDNGWLFMMDLTYCDDFRIEICTKSLCRWMTVE